VLPQVVVALYRNALGNLGVHEPDRDIGIRPGQDQLLNKVDHMRLNMLGQCG
jgi:hypothetical protein